MSSIASRGFNVLGGLAAVRWWNRRYLRILMYHRFKSSAGLAAQCEHLRRHYRPISLDLVAETLSSGREFPDNAIAVTVDDGYQDFAELAYPVFSQYEIPATVFLVSEFIEQRLWLWWDRVEYAFLHSPKSKVSCTLPDGQSFTFQLGNDGARVSAAHRLSHACVPLSHHARCAFLRDIATLLETDVPDRPTARYGAMTWDTVRGISKHGLISFGAHTRTHPILSRLADDALVEKEIVESRNHIQRELSRDVHHFCYPNGKDEDISAAALAVMRQEGFKTAVTAESGVNIPDSDPFRLRRIGVEDDLEMGFFGRGAAAFRAGPAVLRERSI